MAFGTGASGNLLPVSRRRMAISASGIVGRQPRFQSGMRRVTGYATQPSPALSKAGARRQQQRLVPGIPRIMKIRGVARRGGHPVAFAAEPIQIVGGEALRVRNRISLRIARMIRGGSMAGFTADTQLMRHNRLIRGK